jgi:transposase-like protein
LTPFTITEAVRRRSPACGRLAGRSCQCHQPARAEIRCEQSTNVRTNISEVDLGALLRREGLHEAQLAEWREAVQEALEGTRAKKSRSSAEAKRIRQLERELKRKDKALAETAALLVLKKKAQAIWGDGDDDTEPKSGR